MTQAEIFYNKIIEQFNRLQITVETQFQRDPKLSGKSLLLKDKEGFRLFTIRGDRKTDNKKIRKILNSQKLRIATDEELLAKAGVVSGSLPPFGRPLLDVDHYIDEELLLNEFICFNAAITDKKVRIRMEDYLKMVNPSVCEFKKI